MITRSLYNGSVTLEFNEEAHLFLANGKPVDFSVTGATGVIDKPALKFWAANMSRDFLLGKLSVLATLSSEEEIAKLIHEAAKAHTVYTKKAADIGTQAHEWVEKFIKAKTKKDTPELPTNALVHNAITAFLNWVDTQDVKFLESEMPVYSKKHKYAGKLDAIALVHGRRRVIDFKTSSGIYDEMRFQVAAYRGAEEENMGKKFGGDSIIVRFGKDDGEFETMDCPDNDKDYKAFLACLTIRRRQKELKQLMNGNV